MTDSRTQEQFQPRRLTLRERITGKIEAPKPKPTCEICKQTIAPRGASARLRIDERRFGGEKHDRTHYTSVHPKCWNEAIERWST